MITYEQAFEFIKNSDTETLKEIFQFIAAINEWHSHWSYGNEYDPGNREYTMVCMSQCFCRQGTCYKYLCWKHGSESFYASKGKWLSLSKYGI